MDKGIIDLEQNIGVSPGFFETLVSEDDWSFIIKLHALFEAACTHLLLFHFKEPGIASVISRLELSDKTKGKLALLKGAELLGTDDRAFIAKLSELRNSLVHDITNSKYSLKGLVNSFTENQLTKFARTFSPFEARVLDIQEGKGLITKEKGTLNLPQNYDINTLKNRAKANPKEYIWYGAQAVLVSIADSLAYSDYRNWQKAKTMLFEDEA